MKIEKISDTQIRCTLNKDDLIDRELKISELAYGTAKAKALFRELMQQASYECGFEVDDLPLMIEAIPVSPDCLVLVVTKVEDPEELDTRFSNFTPYEDREEEDYGTPEKDAYADEILNCFEQLGHIFDKDTYKKEQTEKKPPAEKKRKKAKNVKLANASVTVPASLVRMYSFRRLSDVCSLAAVIAPFYRGRNSLYKDPARNRYYLVLHISGHSPEEFNKVCNIASEYGSAEQTTYASLSYYNEHYTPVVLDKAVEVLSRL